MVPHWGACAAPVQPMTVRRGPVDALRFPIRIRTRARADDVGGRWGPDGVLAVSVQAPAVDGRANSSLVRVVAGAFDVPTRTVRIVSGHRSRSKVLEISDPPADAAARLGDLLDA